MTAVPVKELFGDGGHDFLNIIDQVILSIQTAPTYTFMSQDNYQLLLKKDPRQSLEIYWKEILYRCYIAAIASLCRHRKWISGILDAAEQPNMFSFAASCRGLLESVADANYSVTNIGINLAENFREIHRTVKGESWELGPSEKFENSLIHFTDATKKSPMVGNKDVYEAKPISHYLDELSKGRKPLVDACYSELCDITHPGMRSVRLFFSFGAKDEDRWQFNNVRDREFIEYFVSRYQTLFSELIQIGFNSSLLALRIINRFELPELVVPNVDDLCFDKIKVWQRISSKLPVCNTGNVSEIEIDVDPADENREVLPATNVRRVGRNSPCPCGSGKKFKNCCLKTRKKPRSD